MADRRPTYHRRRTKRLPRATLAPIAPAPDEEREAETRVPCPTCEPYGGRGLVPANVRAALVKEDRSDDEPDGTA